MMHNPSTTSPSPPWSSQPLVREPSPMPSHSPPPPRSPPSSEPPNFIKQTAAWLLACNTLHGPSCVPLPIPSTSPSSIPRWLIDTHTHCIVPGVSAHRYLALSYVWPESRASSSDSSAPPPRTLLLSSTSTSTFQVPGFLVKEEVLESIPAVIRHAMAFTRGLGERYLWVDRLCIVQDEGGDGGTVSQVGMMDRIYNGAWLTVIAAGGDAMYEEAVSAEGVGRGWPEFEASSPRGWGENLYEFGESTGSEEMDGEFERLVGEPGSPCGRWGSWSEDLYVSKGRTIYGTRKVRRQKMSEEDVVSVMRARYVMLGRSRWATRGWTYQEQILCKRAVVFIESGFFWDCHCCVWDGADLHPGQGFEGIALRADMGQRLDTRSWPDFSLYLDLVCPYNGREFSYPQDAMLGISGVLNALGRSFPGGFVHGLPRLFLDHALLWQPFGTAERRVDRNEEGVVRSSLPSWSWCGWQCYVDPWSLCSGLSYINEETCRRRGGSWRTRNLVEWHCGVGDQEATPITEPLLFDQLVEVDPLFNMFAEFDPPPDQSDTPVSGKLPAGWLHYRKLRYDDEQKDIDDTSSYWVHEKDENASFTHPIPIDLLSPLEHNLLATPAYLTCTTTSASFAPATVLVPGYRSHYISLGPSKISVFEEQMFKDGPRDDHNCPVLVLQAPNGGFAGLLRLPTSATEETERREPLELIAISTGSANARDMRASFEWRIYETGTDAYHNEGDGQTISYKPSWISAGGKVVLLYDIAMAFGGRADEDAEMDKWTVAVLREIEHRCVANRKERVRKHTEKMTKKSHECALSEAYSRIDWYEVRGELLDFAVGEGGNFGGSRRPRWRQPKAASALWAIVRRMVSNRSFFEMVRKVEECAGDRDADGFVCEFYNVLSIERRDGVAYRHACGWVPKAVWEAHAKGSVEVKLG